MRSVVATRYVTPLREGGSLPAVVEAEDDGLNVLKFRAAGQVAPRSTSIQTSAVHTGRCDDLHAALESLLERMVRRPRAGPGARR